MMLRPILAVAAAVLVHSPLAAQDSPQPPLTAPPAVEGQAPSETPANSVDKTVDETNAAIDEAKKAAIEAIEKAREAFKKALTAAKENAGPAIDKAKEATIDALEKAKKATSEVLDKAKQATEDALEAAEGGGKSDAPSPDSAKPQAPQDVPADSNAPREL